MIAQELPEIEIGRYNDIINPSNRLEDKYEVEPLSDHEMQQMSADIKEQYNEGEKPQSKRDRTSEDMVAQNKRQKYNHLMSSSDPESSSGSSSDTDSEPETDDEQKPKTKKNIKFDTYRQK